MMNKYLVKKQPLLDGYQELYRFPNGYGASVVNHSYSYGMELAVILWEGDEFVLCYNTPVTDNVIGYLTAEELDAILNEIYRLE